MPLAELSLAFMEANMRLRVCPLVVFIFSASLLTAEDSQHFSPAQQKVLNVQKAIAEAAHRRDLAAYSRLIAEDCIFSDDDGALVTKAKLLAHFGRMPPDYDHSVNYREHVVHLYGKTAVLNYRVTVHEQFTDTDIVSEQRRTETYVKQNGTWLLVARQWENLPVNLRKPVPIDTSVYNNYVGEFEWRPGSVDTVSVRNGKLWSRMGESTSEFLPLGSDTFFFRDDLGTVEFSRDAQGRVTGYIYHRFDGQEIRARKIK
jgi:ketosteroid isomerase-like protein